MLKRASTPPAMSHRRFCWASRTRS